MWLYHHKLQILAIRSDYLSTPRSQLILAIAIAREMVIQLPEFNQLLKTMEGVGVIQTDPDPKYNLVTVKGSNYLGEQQLAVPEIYQYMAVPNTPACATEIDAQCLPFLTQGIV